MYKVLNVSHLCVILSGGRLTVTSSHTPGSLFPVGETLVQYTATDAAGNSRTCNLTITVQGAELTDVTWLFILAATDLILIFRCTVSGGINQWKLYCASLCVQGRAVTSRTSQ